MIIHKHLSLPGDNSMIINRHESRARAILEKHQNEIQTSNAKEELTSELLPECNSKKDKLPTYADAWRDQDVREKISGLSEKKKTQALEEIYGFFDDLLEFHKENY
ncbi:hypothetical protein [Microviridae sp.]|nr:hypothetical protein [Microviridae sp.]